MDKIYSEFALGADKPFTLLHFTDIHLTETLPQDKEELKVLAQKRRIKYPFSESVLDEIEKLNHETDGLLLITGDMMDFNSAGNLLKVSRFTKDNDCLFIAGNHDFRLFGGMEYDVPEMRELNRSSVQSVFKNDIGFFSKVINGINIVGIDNCYYRFEPWQLERLKEEVKKGFPLVLAMHVPFYTEQAYNLAVKGKRKHASQICVPQEKMTEYPPERYIQQKEDKATREMYEYIMHEPSIKLVICGHIHKDCESLLPSGIPQLVTNVNTARIITIK